MDKATLRHQLIAQRAALTPQEVRRASDAVCRHLAAWPPFQGAATVMAYLAFRNEVSLQPLIDDHPHKLWALPRTLPGGVLSICRYQPGRLVRHPFGMPEPAPDAPLVPLDLIDLVLVPGLAFDRFGGRLGFGGGCYDRLLPHLAAARVGVAHELDPYLVLPMDDHDCRMEWIVCPAGIVGAQPAILPL